MPSTGDTYLHGHHDSVLRSHRWRTAENSAGYLLPRLPAALPSLLLTIQPVGSVGLAAVIFGESPSPLQLLGVLIVLAALLGATMPTRARYAIAGAFGSRASAASISASENSMSSSLPERKAS